MKDNRSFRNSVATGFIWTFAERISAQLVSALVSIILARILVPDDYAPVTIITVFITLCNVVVVNGLGNSLVQKHDADDKDFSSILYLGLFINLILYIALYFAAPLIASFYDMSLLTPIIRVMGIRLILSAVNSVQRAYVSNTMQFRKFFWSTLFGTIVSGFVGILLALNNWGVWALVGQYLTNTTIDTIVLFITIDWRPKLYFSWKRAKTLSSYGWKISAAALMDEVYNSVRTLTIGKVYTPAELSFYNRAEYYPNLLSKNIISAINSVLFPAFSKLQDDVNELKQILKRTIKVSSYLVTPMLIGFAMVAEPLIKLVLTEKWLPCVPYMQIIAISLCISPLSAVQAQVIKALGRSDIILRQEIIKKILGIFMIIVTVQFGLITVVMGVAIFELWCYIINAIPNKKLIGYGFREQFKDVWKNYLCALIMALTIYPISFWIHNECLMLLLQVLVGIISYIIASIVTKNDSFYYLLRVIRERNA